MVGAVFGKFLLVGMLGAEFLVCAKCHVFHDVGGFVDLFVAHVAVTRTEVKLRAHDGCIWHVDQ